MVEMEKGLINDSMILLLLLHLGKVFCGICSTSRQLYPHSGVERCLGLVIVGMEKGLVMMFYLDEVEGSFCSF